MSIYSRAASALLLAGMLAASLDASAQIYTDANGTPVTGVAPLPFPYTPLAPGQHGLAPAPASGLTIPAGARYATICAAAANVEYTTDGATTPTASLGMTLFAGACVALSGPAVLANFRAFSAAGTLDVEYFK